MGSTVRYLSDTIPATTAIEAGAVVAVYEDCGSSFDVIGSGVIEDPYKVPVWRTGAEYTYHEQFMLRGGLDSSHGASLLRYSMGIGVQLARIRLDYAYGSFVSSPQGVQQVGVKISFAGP